MTENNLKRKLLIYFDINEFIINLYTVKFNITNLHLNGIWSELEY